jgi:LacI family transcriptional regulator
MMVRHALAAGHRRLGVLHYGDSGTEEEFIHRLKGIRAACAKAAIRPVEVGMHLKRQSDFTPNQAVDMLLRIDPSITAILCLTDALALNVLESLGERGISVPGRLALIGFDDLPSSAFTSPALTTVRQSVEEIGEALVAGVEALIDGRPPGLGRPIRPHLVVRASCPLPGV